IDRGELRGAGAKEGAQIRHLSIACGVGMDADGPHAAGFVERAPKLLRNPGDAAPQEGRAREPVREERDALGAKRLKRVRIEAMPRSDKDARIKAMPAQHLKALPDPDTLGFCLDTGKFRGAMESQQAAAAAFAEVAIAVQTDGCAGRLERPDLIPELG